MAITSYLDLQNYITAHLELDAVTAEQLPNMIALAEGELNDLLTVPQGETIATASTTIGVNHIGLPPYFNGLRSIQIDDGDPLTLVTFDTLMEDYTDTDDWTWPAPSEPSVYCIANQSIYLGPTPQAVFTVTMTYQYGLTPLSQANPANWLLATRPDAYLYAVLIQAEAFLANDKRLPLLQAKLNDVCGQINKQGLVYRYHGPLRSIARHVA